MTHSSHQNPTCPRQRAYKPQSGFTLLELIVVITIIGLLGTLVVTKVGPLIFRANKTKIKSDLQSIHKTATILYTETGRWPESIEDMMEKQDEDGNPRSHLSQWPTDPWGNDYGYELGDDGPIVTCLGQDGADGGEKDDQDYQYPEEEER